MQNKQDGFLVLINTTTDKVHDNFSYIGANDNLVESEYSALIFDDRDDAINAIKQHPLYEDMGHLWGVKFYTVEMDEVIGVMDETRELEFEK